VSRSEETKTRVLVVAMANSIHTARWLSQFSNSKVDVVLFPSTPSRTLHPKIIELLSGNEQMTLSIAPTMKRTTYLFGILDLFLANNLRAFLLRRLISGQNKFNIIHALELQHAGYLLLKASSAVQAPTRIIISNWGSDIFWFQRFPRHKKKLEALMKIATHYSCECERDVALAQALGFIGTSFPVQPNAGAFSGDAFQIAREAPAPSSRRLVMIKGYTGFVGRADLALQACGIASESLKDFEIVLYSSDLKSRRLARGLAKSHNLNVTIYKKHKLSHERMLELFRSARLYIGISESDGISTSLLDAISSGCFPIQTNTSCANEWVEDGKTGSLVGFQDVKKIAEVIELALSNNALVDNAALVNIETAQTRLSVDAIGRDIAQFYNLNDY
jgi:glycosyltransferase involved in cell wall biosynthesis